MSTWYVKGKQKKYGPYESKKIAQLFKLGKLKEDSLISPDGEQWMMLMKSSFAKSLGMLADTDANFTIELDKQSITKSVEDKQSEKISLAVEEDSSGLSLVEEAPSKVDLKSSKPELSLADNELSIKTASLSLSSINEKNNVSPKPAKINDTNTEQNIQSNFISNMTNSDSISNQSIESSQEDELVIQTEADTMYNDIYMIVLALSPLFVAIGLYLGFPKSVLAMVFSVVAMSMVVLDRKALNKFGMDPPHWFFSFLPPTYMKRREHVMANSYFFTLSSVSSVILFLAIFMFGTNESGSYDDGLYEESYYSGGRVAQDMMSHSLFDQINGQSVAVIFLEREEWVSAKKSDWKWIPSITFSHFQELSEECDVKAHHHIISEKKVEFRFQEYNGNYTGKGKWSKPEHTCLEGDIEFTLNEDDGTLILEYDFEAKDKMLIYFYGSDEEDGDLLKVLEPGSNMDTIMTKVDLSTYEGLGW